MATKSSKSSKSAKTSKTSKPASKTPSKTGKPAVKSTPAMTSPPKGKKTATKSTSTRTKVKVRHVRVTTASLVERRLRLSRPSEPQFAYMKAPGLEHAFEVGDTVEVFCDHEKNNDRIRGWIRGIVVQVDNKMVAVQFRSNVFLTDGWMVPDRILWYPLTSDQIRSTGVKKISKKDFIPEY